LIIVSIISFVISSVESDNCKLLLSCLNHISLEKARITEKCAEFHFSALSLMTLSHELVVLSIQSADPLYLQIKKKKKKKEKRKTIYNMAGCWCAVWIALICQPNTYDPFNVQTKLLLELKMGPGLTAERRKMGRNTAVSWCARDKSASGCAIWDTGKFWEEREIFFTDDNIKRKLNSWKALLQNPLCFFWYPKKLKFYVYKTLNFSSSFCMGVKLGPSH
jgi:hypothetical protein